MKQMNHIFKKLPFLVLCGLMAIGCTKEDEDVTQIYGKAPVKQLTVSSESGPQKGQDHRSSNDFSTNLLLGSGEYLLWMTDCKEDVSFSVMRNKTGSDETIFTALHNGSITEFYGNEKLYIADPQKATQSFKLTVSRISGNAGSIYVNCAQEHLQGETQRASGNFSLQYGKKYEVITPYECTFSIMNDKSASSDDVILTGVKGGQVISGFEEENIYIADVEGALSPFTVEFKPYVQMQSSWMKTLSDTTKVSMMSIPGTHDAGTFVFSPGIAKCQNFDIYTQLVDGIRWLDIRLNKELFITHTVASDLTFEKVMSDVNTFLTENPSEAVFMMIKAEGGEDGFYTALKKWYDDNLHSSSVKTSSRMILDGKMHVLGDIRGKIVLLRRFTIPSSASSFGIDLSSGWPDDRSGYLDAKYENGSESFYIEDRYFSIIEDAHDTNEKKDVIEDAFKTMKHADDQVHYLIYNSIAGHLLSPYAWNYAWGDRGVDPCMMKALNDLMDIYYPENEPGRMGIIMLDYYNKHGNDDPYHIVDRIINTNFSSPIIK